MTSSEITPERAPARFLRHLACRLFSIAARGVEAEAPIYPAVPSGILSVREMDEWADRQGYRYGKRGTYPAETSFLYTKHCHVVPSEEGG